MRSCSGALPADELTFLDELGSRGDFESILANDGTLVALADGGALLVGRRTDWWTGTTDGRTVSTLRFGADTEQWTVIDQAVYARDAARPEGPMRRLVRGHVLEGAMVVRLADGKVLIAGGADPAAGMARVAQGPDPESGTVSDAATLFDPTTGTWTPLPSMPEPRSGGAALGLRDGSVLLVGGHGDQPTCYERGECDSGEGDTGIATAVRFVPER
jgi:hypothetical protein